VKPLVATTVVAAWMTRKSPLGRPVAVAVTVRVRFLIPWAPTVNSLVNAPGSALLSVPA
jgi:hypothetical protein